MDRGRVWCCPGIKFFLTRVVFLWDVSLLREKHEMMSASRGSFLYWFDEILKICVFCLHLMALYFQAYFCFREQHDCSAQVRHHFGIVLMFLCIFVFLGRCLLDVIFSRILSGDADLNSSRGFVFVQHVRRAWDGRLYGSPRAENTVDGLPRAPSQSVCMNTSSMSSGIPGVTKPCASPASTLPRTKWLVEPSLLLE